MPLAVHLIQSGMFRFEQLHELRRGDAQVSGSNRQIEAVGVYHVERLGQQRRIVHVFGAHGKPATLEALPPSGAQLVSKSMANHERQSNSQTLNRRLPVLQLAAAFARFALEAGGQMLDHDGCFDFVAMLPTRARSPRTLQPTVGEQLFHG